MYLTYSGLLTLVFVVDDEKRGCDLRDCAGESLSLFHDLFDLLQGLSIVLVELLDERQVWLPKVIHLEQRGDSDRDFFNDRLSIE